jgi:phosphoglycerate dehydrogenase-like enzyme
MAVARKLPAATAAVQQQAWDGWQPLDYLGAEVHGATLGIIGLGRIGRAVADRAEGFKMRILEAGRGEFQPLKYLLANSDFVSLHAPLTPETHHLIDAEALALMKPTAYLINTSRGGVIDQQALLVALNNQQIAGAALDVTDPEPLPPDHQLLSAPNLLITPHIGSATDVARAKMTEIAVDNLLAGLASEPLAHAVPPAG